MSTAIASPSSPPPKEVTMGMDITRSPSFSVTPSIFKLLRSLDLQLMGWNLDMVPSIKPIMGWEIMT